MSTFGGKADIALAGVPFSYGELGIIEPCSSHPATQKARTTPAQRHETPQLGGLGGWPDLTPSSCLAETRVMLFFPPPAHATKFWQLL
jgi:hypothetical protein